MTSDSRSSNIVFIGFTAGGKTSVGEAVARHLSLGFRDLDTEIERVYLAQTGEAISCREIYLRYGRERFCEFECSALESLVGEERLVLATGGGAVIGERNRDLIAKLGMVVYLRTSPIVIFRRLQARGFPGYLGDTPRLSDIESAWRYRDPLYQEIADVVVDNSSLSIEEVVGEVCRLRESHGQL
jgi:shikimate kinase